MENQNYCLINLELSVCENIVIWNGNNDSWSPPPGYIVLVQATTPTKVWVWNSTSSVWELGVVPGELAQIGYTWDGQFLITNYPQPIDPPLTLVPGLPQPAVDGAQSV